MQLSTAETFDVVVTPDDRHVVFLSSQSGRESPWIVPIDGGEATQLFTESTGWSTMDISSDGRLMFIASGRIVICDLPACANRRDVKVPPNLLDRPRWTPDRQRIAYVGAGGTNLWSVGLDGAAPRQITQFPEGASDRVIATFDWSRDGKRLAIVHTATTNDIVLMRREGASTISP